VFYVYILKGIKNERYYIGYTANLRQRLSQHNAGINRSTKSGRPWQIIYTETMVTKSDAYKREKQIKSYKAGRAFKQLLDGGGGVA